MIKKKNSGLCLNSFQSLSELYNFLQKTPRRKGAENSSENEKNQWNGNVTLEEAYGLMLNGDNDLYREFIEKKDLDVEKKIGNVINKKTFKNDIVGFQPNVPNYILGLPTSMINEEPTKLSQKILNIALCMSVSAFTDSNTIKQIGMRYAQTIDLLEKGGYRVNLYIVHAGSCCGEYNICLVKLKTDKQPFNLKKCVFPIVHPAMFRRIMFRWMECCDVDTDLTHYSYGSPIDDKSIIKKEIEENTKNNFILWNFQNSGSNVDVKSIIKDLKDNYGIKIKGDEDL